MSTCSSTNEWNVRSWFSCSDRRPPWVQARTVVEGEPSRQFPLLKSRLIAVDTTAGTAAGAKTRHKRQRLYCDHLTGQHWLSIIVSLYRYDESREILKPVSRDVADSLSGNIASTGHFIECRP